MSIETERTTGLGFARSRPWPDEDDRPFRQSLEDLSRQLAARRPYEPPPFAPIADVDVPPEPTMPARRSRRHGPVLPLLALMLGVVLAALVHSAINPPPEPQTPVAAALVPPPLPAPVPPPSAADLLPTKPALVDPPPPAAPVIVAAPEPTVSKGKLEGYEIMEIQTRLKALGLNPGPLDGLSGAQTVTAIKQYEASKSRPQTGKLDRDLLKQLRQEPKEQAATK
jgi:putative peptidoglycan binding protein